MSFSFFSCTARVSLCACFFVANCLSRGLSLSRAHSHSEFIFMDLLSRWYFFRIFSLEVLLEPVHILRPSTHTHTYTLLRTQKKLFWHIENGCQWTRVKCLAFNFSLLFKFIDYINPMLVATVVFAVDNLGTLFFFVSFSKCIPLRIALPFFWVFVVCTSFFPVLNLCMCVFYSLQYFTWFNQITRGALLKENWFFLSLDSIVYRVFP